MYDKLINEMKELNKKNREMFYDDVICVGIPFFAKEFCTIKIDIGRRTGKTSYIKEHNSVDTLILVPDKKFAKEYAMSSNVMTAHEFTNAKSIDVYREIYIDNPSIFFKYVDSHYMYERTAKDIKLQTFILLG